MLQAANPPMLQVHWHWLGDGEHSVGLTIEGHMTCGNLGLYHLLWEHFQGSSNSHTVTDLADLGVQDFSSKLPCPSTFKYILSLPMAFLG